MVITFVLNITFETR